MSEPTPRPDDTALLGKALTIFRRAIEVEPQRRDGFLIDACEGVLPLRRAVDELLEFHLAEDSAFDTAGLRSSVTMDLASSDLGEGARFGSYRILGRAGAGGMGVVYRAEQDNPRRIVALKVMRLELDSLELLARFHREVQFLGQLQHPGIAQVFDTGTFELAWGSVPYFAMELVEGVPVDEFVRERDLDAGAVCRLLIQICEAVQHAHERGVVHRDLKPGNVLVVDYGDGRLQPKVLDFGIACSVGSDEPGSTKHTATGQLLGTLSYMSPERAMGSALVDHRADVYSLGVMLYELLARKLPFDLVGRSIADVAKILAHDDPTRLGQVDAKLRGDLETVVDKALTKDPNRRYPTAAELAADLERHLANQPIHAQPISTWYYVRKSVRRHRVLFGGIAATLVALGLGLIAALVLAEQNKVLASSERLERQTAERARDDLRSTLYRSEMRFVAQAMVDLRGKERARTLLSKWLPEPGEEDLREFEWRLAHRITFTEALVYEGCRDVELHWSQAGIQFVRGGHWVTVDPATGEATRIPRVNQGLEYDLRIAADRDRYVMGGRTGLTVASFATGKAILSVALEVVDDVRISPDGRFVAAAAMPGGLHKTFLYDTVERCFICEPFASEFGNRSFEFSGSSRWFASTQKSGLLRIWDCKAPGTPREIQIRAQPTFSMDWSRDDTRIAIGYRSGWIDLIDVASGTVMRTLRHHDSRVSGLRWSADMSRILSAGNDSTVRVSDTATGDSRVLGGHHGESLRVVWSPDEQQVASCGSDMFLRVFDVRSASSLRPLPVVDDAAAIGVAWTADGASLIVDYEDNTAHVHPETGVQTQSFAGRNVRWSPSRSFYSVWRDGRLQVCSAATNQPVVKHAEWPGSFARWHATNDEVAIVDLLTGCWLWRASDANLKNVSTSKNIYKLAWHPDGRALVGVAGSTMSFTIRWDEGVPSVVGHSHGGDPRAWGCSPDGTQYALEHRNFEVQVFDRQSGDLMELLVGHAHLPRCIEWNPSGSRIATADAGGTLRFWDAGSAEEVFSVNFEQGVTHMVWSPSGQRIALLAGGAIYVLDGR